MQEKMQSDLKNYQNQTQQKASQPEPSPKKEGDYIDFEEIKK